MNTIDIVKNKLDFLLKDYGMAFEYNNIRGNHYIFKNPTGYIEFYEWKQFNESAIFIKYGLTSRKIDLLEEYPKIIGKFYQKHKGLKRFFRDDREEYWEIVAEIIKTELFSKKSIFGLQV